MGFLFWAALAGLALVVVAMMGLQSVPTSEERRRLGAVLGLYPANGRITFTGDTAGTNVIANVSSFAGLQIGMTLSGTGVAPGNTIQALDSATNQVVCTNVNLGVHAGVTITASWVATSAQVHLYSAPFTGGLDPTPADFTEATFDTYAAINLPVPAGPYTNPDGSAEADFGDLSWVLFADPVVGNTIYGYWIDYIYPAGAATRVVSVWENFPTPIDMEATGNAVVISVPITLPDPSAATQP